MKTTPLADPERLREIMRLDLLSRDTQETLDRLAQNAAEAIGTSTSLVSVVLDQTQFFAANFGLAGTWLAETRGTPLEWSLCKQVVESGQELVIANTREREDCRDNPLVTEDNLTCYAGTPLVTRNGYVVGSLCVLGQTEHDFVEGHLQILRKLAAEAISFLEERAAEKALDWSV